MSNDLKRRIAYEVMILLCMLALLTLVTRLWPILLLIMLGILVCALRLLFLRARNAQPEELVPTPTPCEPEPPETELSLTRKAFGLLQRRIAEHITQQYPGAKWVWGAPNAIERFSNDEPLPILLNAAGGYQKAQVIVKNLQFKGLYYKSAETHGQAQPPAVTPDDNYETSEHEYDLPDEAPVNYERLAFEWVDEQIAGLSAGCNEAIAQKEKHLLIPSEKLPHPDSWPDICDELKRGGMPAADICDGGIKITITQ